MMAADNDEAFDLDPGFILETVEAAKSFFDNKLIGHTTKRTTCCHGDTVAHTIHTWLDWPHHRVRSALAQLRMTEEKVEKDGTHTAPTPTREAIKNLPTEQSAERFARAVSKAVQAGRPISRPFQEKIAKEIAQTYHTGRRSGSRLATAAKVPADSSWQ
jgi:hypothetical protein